MFPINDDAPQINGRPFINYGLIAINVIIFIYEMIFTSNFSNKLAQFVLIYKLWCHSKSYHFWSKSTFTFFFYVYAW